MGVLDKAVAILDAVAEEPATLADLVRRTDLSRATAHRLALALELHGLLARGEGGRFVVGPRAAAYAAAAGGDVLAEAARPVLAGLRDATGESAQLYVRQGEMRVCVAAAERGSGLRDTVPVGATLPLTAGSAAQVLLAWDAEERVAPLLHEARFDAATLRRVRELGWAATSAEREAGVGSVSAPVQAAGGGVLAAVSVSGPLDRLGREPGTRHAAAVVAAASDLAVAVAGRV